MSNSRPYGKNTNRDWLLRQQMQHKFASGLESFAASVDEEDDTPKAAQQSPYPGHHFRSEEACAPLRIEELILWLIDPYDTSYGGGVYSPVRISPTVADYIRRHKTWDKFCYIETTPPSSRTSVMDDGEVVVISEPSALWLWRLKDWNAVYAVAQERKAQTEEQRRVTDALERRYFTVIDNVRKRYPRLSHDLALMMIQDWESQRETDKTAGLWLKKYGWYELDEKGERVV